MKVVTVAGARPQFIKLAPVSKALRGGATEIVVHTGQHYDHEMSQGFFDELAMDAPTYNLGIGSGTHAEQTARVLTSLEPVLQAARPDWVIVFGDTNSTLAAALCASKLNIPVAHVEAGLRSFNRRMPEELNRVLTDHLAVRLYAPSRVAVANLAAEGITDGVVEVGDVMVDSLMDMMRRAPNIEPLLDDVGIRGQPYLVATLHRAGNTESPEILSAAMGLLVQLGLPVVLPLHPRTRAALDRFGLWDRYSREPALKLLAPVSYGTMLALMAGARAVVTDSGGLQKEAYLLQTPCLTLRNETEWVETCATGWNNLVGLDPLLARQMLGQPAPAEHPKLYGDPGAAERLVADLLACEPLASRSAIASAPTRRRRARAADLP